MGLLSPRSSSSSGTTEDTIASALAKLGYGPETFTGPEPQGAPPSGLGRIADFASNVGNDIVDMGRGLSSLLGTPLHDVYSGAQKLVPGGSDGQPFRTPELLKNLVYDPDIAKQKGMRAAISPVMQEYGQEAYGVNPLQGDLTPDLAKIRRSAYEHPLSTVLDFYGGASLAGRGMTKVAKNEVRMAKAAGRPISEFAKRVLPGVDPDSPLYDPTGKISQGGVTRRLREWGDNELELVPLAENPVKRFSQTVWRKSLSSSVDNVPAEVKRRAKLLERMEPKDADAARLRWNEADPSLMEGVRLYEAAKKHGVTRLEHKRVAEFRAKSEASRLLSTFSAHGYSARNQDMRDVQGILESNLTTDELPEFMKPAQGMPLATGERVMTAGRFGIEAAPEALSALRGRVPDEQLADIESRFARLRQHQQATIQKRNEAMMNMDLEPEAKAKELQELQDELDATDLYGRMLSEYPSALLAGDNVNGYARAIAELRHRWDDVVKENIDRELMGGYRDVLSRTFGPMLVERKAKRLADGTFDITDFKYEALAGEDPLYWKTLASEFDAKGWASPLYYPHYDARRLSRGEFMMKRGRFMEAQAGKRPFRYNEYWNYVNGTVLDDPVEAYARRIAHVRRIVEAQKLSENVAKIFGRKVKTMDEISGSEVAFNPKMHREVWRTRLEMDEAMSTMKELGNTDERALAEGLREVAEKRKQDAIDGVDGMEEVWAIPKAVADQLDSYAKYQFGDMGRIWFDGPVNMWRSAVLAFSPRWILNNLLGNVTFLKMQGGRLSDVLRDWKDPRFQQAVDRLVEKLPEDVRETVREQINSGLFSETETYRSRIAGAQDKVGGRLAAGYETSKVGQRIGAAREWMQNLNSHVEQHFRRASFIRGIEREAARAGVLKAGQRFHTSAKMLEDIADAGLTEQSALRAVDELNYFFNDYRRLSSFERNIIRRFIAPFYSFYRHTAKLTLSYPFEYPERAFTLRMLGEVARELDEDVGMRPEYLQGAIPFGQGQMPGETRFINTRGANPLEGFVGTVADPRTLGGLAGPHLKTLLETVTGRDQLTGRPFTQPDVGGSFGMDEKFKVIFDDNGNPIGVGEDPVVVRPPLLEMFARQFPQADLIRDVGSWLPYPGNPTPFEVGTRYDTGEERYVGGAPANEQSVGQSLGQWAGFSTSDFDLGAYQERAAAGRQAALVAVLRALGELPPAEETE